MRRAFAVVLSSAASLCSQQSPQAEQFLPPEHTNVFGIDFAAVRAIGLWPEITASALQPALQQLQARETWKFEDLDRVIQCPVAGEDGRRLGEVSVFEAHVAQQLPKGLEQNGAIGGFATHATAGGEPGGRVWLAPRPELTVHGHRALLESILGGKDHSGRPSADVLSLLSGRGRNLAWLVVDVRQAPLQKMSLTPIFGEAVWPADDQPRFLMARVRSEGEAAAIQVVFEGVLRLQRGAAGMDVAEPALRQWLAKLGTQPQFAGLAGTWQQIEIVRKGTDLVASLRLGPPKQAAAPLAVLLAPMLPRTQSPPTVREIAPSAPVPQPPRK